MGLKKLLSIVISSITFSYVIYLAEVSKQITPGQGCLLALGVGVVVGILHALFFPFPGNKNGK